MKPPGWGPLLLASGLLAMGAADEPKSGRPALEMSKAVVCKSVEGYERYEALPDASLTSEDKLNVYFRPLHFRVEAVEKPRPGRRFKAGFVEDCRIRRKGEKVPFMKKDKLLEYDATFEAPGERLYLVNNISMKGLAPGDYELDVILHDAFEPESSATQSVAFTVIPTPKAEGAEEPKPSPAPSPTPEPKKTKPKPGQAKP